MCGDLVLFTFSSLVSSLGSWANDFRLARCRRINLGARETRRENCAPRIIVEFDMNSHANDNGDKSLQLAGNSHVALLMFADLRRDAKRSFLGFIEVDCRFYRAHFLEEAPIHNR